MVLDAFTRSHLDSGVYGLWLCKTTGLGSGTVYPILDRLERAGWVEARWEDSQPSGRPKRRSYVLTGAGKAAYAADQHRRGASHAGPDLGEAAV